MKTETKKVKFHNVNINLLCYYSLDLKKIEMNILEKQGKEKTIKISISILLISLHTIYFYHSVREDFDTTKFATQMIRFTLTCVLLYFLYKGHKWAKIISIILFSIGVIGATVGLFITETSIINKTPFIVMIIIYAMAIYHFTLSESFKAFYSYQNQLNNN